MNKVKIEKLTEERLEKMGVMSWPIWEKEISRFDWHYDETEVCYILKGKVTIETKDGEKVNFFQYQFVRTGTNDFECLLTGIDSYNPNDYGFLEKRLRDILWPEVNLKVKPVETLPLGKSGKLVLYRDARGDSDRLD